VGTALADRPSVPVPGTFPLLLADTLPADPRFDAQARFPSLTVPASAEESAVASRPRTFPATASPRTRRRISRRTFLGSLVVFSHERAIIERPKASDERPGEPKSDPRPWWSGGREYGCSLLERSGPARYAGTRLAGTQHARTQRDGFRPGGFPAVAGPAV